jgi:hypothetical protein
MLRQAPQPGNPNAPAASISNGPSPETAAVMAAAICADTPPPLRWNAANIYYTHGSCLDTEAGQRIGAAVCGQQGPTAGSNARRSTHVGQALPTPSTGLNWQPSCLPCKLLSRTPLLLDESPSPQTLPAASFRFVNSCQPLKCYHQSTGNCYRKLLNSWKYCLLVAKTYTSSK